MRKPNAAVAFYVLSIVLLPVSLLGYLIWVGKLLAARPSGVSTGAGTALRKTQKKRAWGGFAVAVVE
ncbi:hypothetical protein [Arthrobacter sp. AZCC_0090]|uniref:hypothetical protein n=1 Tax=Arthrobacter sp. AZCC_0090 TaxID=2735881 RepID=UPI00161301ED|nr:hypothetical protein [Arthrobacter sp. AZCC_0090]MBB6405648.1 hypothetical protein [Arthrobacter sp. AZCC_0090]